MNKMKYLIAFCIGLIPLNSIRVLAYKYVFGYKIIASRIGFRTILLVEKLELYNCRIGAYNKFIGPMHVYVDGGASIGSYNVFNCPDWTAENSTHIYKRKLTFKKKSMLTNGHYIDVAGAFSLGSGSWIAGTGSQFWTHGAGVENQDIAIGTDCYIGSAVRFVPGSGLGNNVILGMGSVVTKRIEEDNVMVAGIPAKIIKSNYNWKEN